MAIKYLLGNVLFLIFDINNAALQVANVSHKGKNTFCSGLFIIYCNTVLYIRTVRYRGHFGEVLKLFYFML